MYAVTNCESSYDAALALAKGDYQENVLIGYESLSGSTLKGKAKKWGMRYRASAQALLSRLDEAGIPHGEYRGRSGKRILCIGIGCATEAEWGLVK